MRRVEQTITIQAPPHTVWDVLSDLAAMRHYMPGTESVTIVSEQDVGVGATRHCVFEDGVELTEQVAEWNSGKGYVLETTAAVKVPMRSNQITFQIDPATSGTEVRQAMEYTMKGGLVSPLLERLATGRMRAALAGSLSGLKQYVERTSRPDLSDG